MIGEIYEYTPAPRSGRIRPVGSTSHPGFYFHVAGLGRDAQPTVGMRVIYTPWTSRDGREMAVNVKPATEESEEVERCLS